MKKPIYFIPAIIFIVFYGLVIISMGFSVSPVVFVWIATFIISGVLLSEGIFWGGCFGILSGVHFMYMSTQDTGQILPIEMPLGMIIVFFYLLCCIFVLRKKKKQKFQK